MFTPATKDREESPRIDTFCLQTDLVTSMYAVQFPVAQNTFIILAFQTPAQSIA